MSTYILHRDKIASDTNHIRNLSRPIYVLLPSSPKKNSSDDSGNSKEIASRTMMAGQTTGATSDRYYFRSAIEELRLTRKLDSGGAIHSKNTELLSIVSDCVYRDVTDEVVLLEARERVYENCLSDKSKIRPGNFKRAYFLGNEIVLKKIEFLGKMYCFSMMM